MSHGAVELLDERETTAEPVFVISLDTSGLATEAGGVTVRSRERFEIVASEAFPFEVPRVWSVHRRWAETAHVQWGRFLCLYAAPSVEWSPADGMRGFVERLSEWLEHAAAGTLDPDGQPLHPPAVYQSVDAGRVLIHPDLGDRVPWGPDGTGGQAGTRWAWCVVRGRRVDVIEWLDQQEAAARAVDENAPVFDHDRPYVVLPVVLIPGQIGFEYPRAVSGLSAGLSEHGYSREQLLWDLASASLINRHLRTRQLAEDPAAAGQPWNEGDEGDDPDDPDEALFTAMIVGTPSRRVDGGARLAHLAAWRVDSLSARVASLYGDVRADTDSDLPTEVQDIALSWFASAKAMWMRVMETRPEVTRRRDAQTPATWLAGRRVLVLGCGALGGPVAEYCVRAGVAALSVADASVVNPGILVRQLFTDADIGRPKAHALASRLSPIRPDLTVTPLVGDVRATVFTAAEALEAYDLIIDATADATVRSVIERHRLTATARPPLATMVIGHDATRGLVTTSLATTAAAGADAFRKVALLASSGNSGWSDIADDLFPRTPRTERFFPEPGCSAPTFVGAASQTAALAGMMLNEALDVLAADAVSPKMHSGQADLPGGQSGPTTFASAVRIGAAAVERPGLTHASWLNDIAIADPTSGFVVRLAPAALAEARAEVRHGARVRTPAIETGGMLLGAIDDASGIIHVDRVTGPPPDSYLSETYFQHGVDGVQDRIDAERAATAQASGFIGFWHTHPNGPAWPSPTDEQGMASIVGPDGTRSRALMMILGGHRSIWEPWRDGHAGPTPDVYVRLVPRAAGSTTAGHPGYVGGLDLQLLPPGTYFRGTGNDRMTVAARGGSTSLPSGLEALSLWQRFWTRR